MSKKILFITRDFSPYCSQTGWMIRNVSLASFLARNGNEVHVLASKRAKEYHELSMDKTIKRHWVENILHYSLTKSLWWIQPNLFLYALLRLCKNLKRGAIINS